MRKKVIRKCMAGLLAVLMTVSVFALIFAEDTEPTLNQDILEAMLNGSRHWVIETLVDDDRSNNPMAICWESANDKSMAQKAYEQYRGTGSDTENGRFAYRTMVNAMYFAYNKDEYIKGFFDEAGELLAWAIGLFGKDEVTDVADTLSRSRNVIPEVLCLLKGKIHIL